MSRDIEGLIEEWERLENVFHDAIPQGQGDPGDGGIAGKALCQFLYDNSEALRAALRTRAPVTGDVDRAEAEFTAYFVRNYPGPDTIIHKPEWHAPRIWRAALAALRTASSAWPDNMGDAADPRCRQCGQLPRVGPKLPDFVLKCSLCLNAWNGVSLPAPPTNKEPSDG